MLRITIPGEGTLDFRNGDKLELSDFKNYYEHCRKIKYLKNIHFQFVEVFSFTPNALNKSSIHVIPRNIKIKYPLRLLVITTGSFLKIICSSLIHIMSWLYVYFWQIKLTVVKDSRCKNSLLIFWNILIRRIRVVPGYVFNAGYAFSSYLSFG